MKSVNYLPNVLSKMEAEEKGAFAAIWLDGDGFIAEGPNMNVAFVTKEKELLMPQFDKILSGCTAKRVLALAEGLVKEGKLRGVRVENVTVEEGKKADEMMLIGSGILVRPIVQWDEQIIGDGKNLSAPCYATLKCLAYTYIDTRHTNINVVHVFLINQYPIQFPT
jgi:4-amino-4-deoxychorismate lyase